jgi:hypothetical protein
MTPKDAETRATELGLPPLLHSPIPTEFDPTTEPFWSIPMVLAWIMTREADCVRDVWDPWCTEREFWSPCRWQVPGGPVYEGFWIETHGPTGLIDLSVRNAVWRQDGKRVISRSDAQAALLSALQAGKVEATGIPTRGVSRAPIAAFSWRDLDLYDEKGRVVARTNHGLGAGYDDLAVTSNVVQMQWRAVSNKINATARGEKAAISALVV